MIAIATGFKDKATPRVLRCIGMTEAFTYQQHRLAPISTYDKLDELASALDHEGIRQWLCKGGENVNEVIARRVKQEREAAGITFAIESEKRVVGFCGLIGYGGSTHDFQTTTYLRREVWGSGMNEQCKIVQAGLAASLGLSKYVASVHADNTRSIKSISKLYPNNELRSIYEYWIPRKAMVMELEPQYTDYADAGLDLSKMRQVMLKTQLGRLSLDRKSMDTIKPPK